MAAKKDKQPDCGLFIFLPPDKGTYTTYEVVMSK